VTRRLRAAGSVFAEDEARLLVAEAVDDVALEASVVRRAAGEPLEQVLGWVAFAGRRIIVEPGVFVPRRRTELVAREASAALAARPARPGSDPPARGVRATPAAPPVVVELCCGAAAVSVVLADEHPGIELWATDLDPVAVRCARHNVAAVGSVVEGDLFAGLPPGLRGRVALVAANAPYVPTAAIAMMPPEARLHETPLALDGGDDGLDLHRRIAAEVGDWLAPGGTLVLETSARQAGRTQEALVTAGLSARVVRDDEVDGTVVVAVAP